MIPVKPNSVAVLKFLHINNDEAAQIFSDGLGEDVLDRLARVPGLSVASRGDSWSLPENASSTIVRKRLRVAYFLEGSVRLIDGDLRVVVQLIETATDHVKFVHQLIALPGIELLLVGHNINNFRSDAGRGRFLCLQGSREKQRQRWQ